MIRLFDILLSILGLVLLLPILIIIWILLLFQNGSPLFNQTRIGKNQKKFTLIKFRTMRTSTKSVPTHLVKKISITRIGFFLRKTKIDEIPQLFNVLKGDMSLVGPRPCLINQKKLIKERKRRGVYKVKQGITGLAQLSGILMKTPTLLAKTDLKMIKEMNLFNYFYYIFRTIFKIIR